MQFDEAKRRLEENDEAFLFLDEDLNIHLIDQHEGRISWYDGSRGHDQHTSLKMLEIACKYDGKKIVHKNDVREEADKLVEGEWDTVKEWQES